MRPGGSRGGTRRGARSDHRWRATRPPSARPIARAVRPGCAVAAPISPGEPAPPWIVHARGNGVGDEQVAGATALSASNLSPVGPLAQRGYLHPYSQQRRPCRDARISVIPPHTPSVSPSIVVLHAAPDADDATGNPRNRERGSSRMTFR